MNTQALADESHNLVAVLESGTDDPRTLVAALSGVGRLSRLLSGLGVELAGEVAKLYDDDGSDPDRSVVRALGERSPQMLLQAVAGLDALEAMAWVRVGVALRPEVSLLGESLPARHPAIAEALADGRLHIGAAERVLAVLHEIEPNSSVTERDEVERFLVASAPEVTARQFARICASIPAKFEPENIDERERQLRAKSGITVRQGDDGLVHITIKAHPEAAGVILTALDAVTAPRRGPVFAPSGEEPIADSRPLSTRRLDALVSIARESLGRDHGVMAGNSVTMRVTVTLDALISGLGTAKIDGVDEPISAATARRLASDAQIIPVVLGGPSEPLDLGRAVRLASGPQRDALAVRDGGCIWPGCDAPPGWCEVAHIVAWTLGGATDLDNMMLLCPFHHRCFDTGGWELQRINGRRHLIPPTWVDSARTPRAVNEPIDLAA